MASVFLLKKPWVTEKSSALRCSVSMSSLWQTKATKPEIKKAVKDVYKVDGR